MTAPTPSSRNTPSPYGWEQWQHDLLPSAWRAALRAALVSLVVVAAGMAAFALTTGNLPNSNPISAAIFGLNPTAFDVILLTTVTTVMTALDAAFLVWCREARLRTFNPFTRNGALNLLVSVSATVGAYCLANLVLSDHNSLMVGVGAWIIFYGPVTTWIIDSRWRVEMRRQNQ